ncbi:MAG: 50S ribosomal protein L22 [Candidatus Harrisonbacteria bacterium CG10_big_fil_rev_8_21_14_0_10_45_28]|uniref:Large ribosomal subunit protein uL22 n=1 Tax=Candidatus Harrisonbacteria bacterium CG10_big_fil_rev_8_21_14_0_10_45_28 TaxID=1974586 RepID=A0A2H0UNY2_9BACT|nr:MAG: 50S ribosomal protein L22 [Candidatus Harrisonbacteria bacterium CG10_big_fil_rev_8_21_14_0_10_45_28]
MKTQSAKLSYLNVAPRKVRLIANAIKKLPVKEAEAQLLLRSQRSSGPLLKLLRSAVANAKNKDMDVAKLVVSAIWVDGAPVLKRFLPRAQGRATPLLKRMSHITIVLAESDKKKGERFTIIKPEKKSARGGSASGGKKRAKKPVMDKPEKEEPKTKMKDDKSGIKKFFRRKSV